MTPLMWATSLGYNKILAVLLTAGADASLVDKDGFERHDDVMDTMEEYMKSGKGPPAILD